MTKFLNLNHHGNSSLYDVGDGKAVPVDDRYLKKQDPKSPDFSDAGKQKLLAKLTKGEKVKTLCIPDLLPNTGSKVHPDSGRKHKPTDEDFTLGVRALLLIRLLFPALIVGYALIADLLIAMRCSVIRCACRGSVRFIVELRSASAELIDLLSQLLGLAATKHRWRGRLTRKYRLDIRRDGVLDYRSQQEAHPYSVAEFTEATLKRKHLKKIRFPARYVNTIAMIVGAGRSQAREMLRLMGDSVVWLVNSGRPDGVDPDVTRADSMSEISKSVLDAITADAPLIRVTLKRWWEASDTDETAWAEMLVKRARARLRRPEQGDYIVLSPSLVKLRHALRCEVLLSFVDEAEQSGFLTGEAAAALRVEIEDSFYPRPVAEAKARRLEDPGEFRALMSTIAADNLSLIIGEDERFVRSERRFGALRVITGTTYLVMPESTWAAAYRKAAKAAGLDTSFCGQSDWEQKLQRILVEAGLIKHVGSNPRYRYDLYGTGKRDTTYVVAVPWDSIGSV